MTVTVVVGDVLHAPPNHAIAHCIAEDLLQNAGFAKKNENYIWWCR